MKISRAFFESLTLVCFFERSCPKNITTVWLLLARYSAIARLSILAGSPDLPIYILYGSALAQRCVLLLHDRPFCIHFGGIFWAWGTRPFLVRRGKGKVSRAFYEFVPLECLIAFWCPQNRDASLTVCSSQSNKCFALRIDDRAWVCLRITYGSALAQCNVFVLQCHDLLHTPRWHTYFGLGTSTFSGTARDRWRVMGICRVCPIGVFFWVLISSKTKEALICLLVTAQPHVFHVRFMCEPGYSFGFFMKVYSHEAMTSLCFSCTVFHITFTLVTSWKMRF